MGDIAFGEDGEMSKSYSKMVQYQQVLANAVEAAKGLDQDELADWLRGHTAYKWKPTGRGNSRADRPPLSPPFPDTSSESP